jgi:hypothetical protein
VVVGGPLAKGGGIGSGDAESGESGPEFVLQIGQEFFGAAEEEMGKVGPGIFQAMEHEGGAVNPVSKGGQVWLAIHAPDQRHAIGQKEVELIQRGPELRVVTAQGDHMGVGRGHGIGTRLGS